MTRLQSYVHFWMTKPFKQDSRIPTHSIPLVTFCTPWKHQKISGFVIFFRGYSERPVARNWLNNENKPYGSRMFLFAFYLTSFFPMFPFDPPLNISLKPVLNRLWCFLGDQKRTSGKTGLTHSFPVHPFFTS